MQNSSSDVEEVEYAIDNFKGRETGEKQPKEERDSKKGSRKDLTVAEANSTTKRTFEVKVAEMKS